MGHTKPVNVAVMLWTCSHEVIGSNLGWDIVYSDWSVSWFRLFLIGKYRDSPSNRARPHPFSISFPVHLFMYHKILFFVTCRDFCKHSLRLPSRPYTEGPWFEYRPEHRIFRLKFVMDFFFSTAPPPISFPVYLSSWHLTLCSLHTDSIVK
jgi:hypothetical protein